MKIRSITLLILFVSIFSFSALGQDACTLSLKGDRLIGTCENPLFTDFEIVLEKQYESISMAQLFKALPKSGIVTIQKQAPIDVEFVITKRSGFKQVMFKPTQVPRVGWYTFDDLKETTDGFAFTIDIDPTVPASKKDLKIIKEARKLLASPENWNQEDDRRCEDDKENNQFSFFCALQTASIKVEGAYNHRNAVMQMMRHLIAGKFPGKEWEHRFKDYNNMTETTFESIHAIIDEAEVLVKKELKDKK